MWLKIRLICNGGFVIFSHGEYGYSTVEINIILGNGFEIQEQNYVVWFQGSEMLLEFDIRYIVF